MIGPDARLADVNFSSTDFVKLVAATYLPLCDELEAAGVIDRGRLADAMGRYVQPDDVSSSAALLAALQMVLRRPRSGQDAEIDASIPTRGGESALRVILGGRHQAGEGEAG